MAGIGRGSRAREEREERRERRERRRAERGCLFWFLVVMVVLLLLSLMFGGFRKGKLHSSSPRPAVPVSRQLSANAHVAAARI